MRIRLDPDLHRAFLDACQQIDKPAAQVIREFMREYVMQNPVVSQGELFVAEQNASYKKG
ncbi:plasmid-related protein [Thiohalophilus sp.]|uniref:plasmid-related protein n=1 Tax=Thiohalophilus sp. TaxID=3028392 RepID=UPI003A0FFCC9